MKYCQNCGSEVKENDAFCVSCGSPLEKPTTSENSSSNPDLFGFEEQSHQNTNQTYNYQQNQTQYQNYNQYQPAKTNTLCVVGFVLSFIFSFIGLIISCIGLGQVKKNPNEKGKGFAIAGIVLGVLGTILSFYLYITKFMNIMGSIQ